MSPGTADAADLAWMDLALALARSALGRTSPNPAVGAILVRDGVVLGEGATRPPGGEHAEIVALRRCREAGHDPAGATLYVTLEPCCHHGRTPPCTDALVAAGVSRVVVGAVDPFPAVQGRGLALLRQAGVEVSLGLAREACERQVLGFARAVTSGLPEVTAKAAISADGHIATASGESRWITGELARLEGHRLRAVHDALLVGVGTVLADDPALTTRLPDGPVSHAVPVVLDTSLRTPADARLLSHPKGAVILCGERAPARELPARVVRLPVDAAGRVDLEAALRALVELGLHRVLVEGGGEIHRSFLDRRLVDTLHLFVAGTVLPGGIPWVGGAPVAELGQAVRMTLESARELGGDAWLVFRARHGLAPDPMASLRTEPTHRGREG